MAEPAQQPKAAGSAARGIPLFKAFGIQIRIDWSWLIIFFLFVFVLQAQFARTLDGVPQWAIAVLAAASVIALFACVLAHELGHSLVAIRNGIQMFDITLFVFGGMARLRGEPKTPNVELKMALAGPAVTVALAVLFWAAWAYIHHGTTIEQSTAGRLVAEGIHYLAYVNTALLIFNMIPGFPLDGGRVLRAILWKVRGNIVSATKTAAAIGSGFGMVLIFLGVLIIFNGALLQGAFMAFIGWFLASAANQSVQFVQLRDILEQFRVADAMQSPVVTVPPNLTLDRLVQDDFIRHRFKSFPVADEQNRFVGYVGLHHVQSVQPGQWPGVTVAMVADPAAEAMTIRPSDGLYEAFRRMGEEDVGRLVVTDDQWHVLGLITRRDIMNLMRIYSELQPQSQQEPRVIGFRRAIPLAEPEGQAASNAPIAPPGRALEPPPSRGDAPPHQPPRRTREPFDNEQR